MRTDRPPTTLFRTLRAAAHAAVLFALAGTTMGASLPTLAGDAEAELKAAFLYNFALYTEWPQLGATFGICIAGKDELGLALDALARKAVAGRPVHLQRLDNGDVPDACNVLFIGGGEATPLADLPPRLSGRPILIVVENEHSYSAGAMLRLTREQGRLTFDANQTAARNAGLRFSAKLLRLARRVD